ncbi:head-tail connector protein [Pararhodobacter zhoushanensis]|uniref:Phage gp6-like head-tail connector protein n=1 Tax=Pararhodobacter zhoushanensis TaxID=2479545 RepID=A0ABT3GYL4_9RHOB|nr:hypothetical protein [Pararhodobacter zhoushanensis]MCW1932617.1 hypothetical protein [Pararhodobacter zhoushanensis]
MSYQHSTLITAPVAALISSEAAQRWVRRGDDADDLEDTNLLLASAMSHLDGIDGILRRALITQTWQDTWSAFPTGERLPLALAPVASIASITYVDDSSVEQTLASSTYRLHKDFSGAFLRLDPESSWPSTADRDDAVQITYVAGYGDAAADVPAEIRLAVQELIEQWDGLSEASTPEVLPAKIMTKLRRFIRPHF